MTNLKITRLHFGSLFYFERKKKYIIGIYKAVRNVMVGNDRSKCKKTS